MNEENHVASVLTTGVVAAFVANNAVECGDLPVPIGSVDAALGGPGKPNAVPPIELIPAVSIKKSVLSDHIICLDDGKKIKCLKQHLAVLGMTPDEYRAIGGCRPSIQWWPRAAPLGDYPSPYLTAWESIQRCGSMQLGALSATRNQHF